MTYEARKSMVTIRAQESERETWRRAAAVQGFDGLSTWARAILNLASGQVLAAATEEAPSSELLDKT